MHVGDGCHAVPRATVGRDWMCRIIPLARVCRASNLNDSVTVILNKVMRRAAYFVSIQSKDLTHSPTRFFATEAQNDKPIPRSPFPVPCSRLPRRPECGSTSKHGNIRYWNRQTSSLLAMTGVECGNYLPFPFQRLLSHHFERGKLCHYGLNGSMMIFNSSFSKSRIIKERSPTFFPPREPGLITRVLPTVSSLNR